MIITNKFKTMKAEKNSKTMKKRCAWMDQSHCGRPEPSKGRSMMSYMMSCQSSPVEQRKSVMSALPKF
jgi:hypothetical protein